MEIKFRPVKEIVILEEIEYDTPKDLFKDLIAGTPSGASVVALWAEGIVFRHNGLPLKVESVAKERMKGKVYWSDVKYAKMPEFRESETVDSGSVGIVKAEAPALKEVAKKLRERIRE